MDELEKNIDQLKKDVHDDHVELRELDVRVKRYEVEMTRIRNLLASIKRRLEFLASTTAEKRSELRERASSLLKSTDFRYE